MLRDEHCQYPGCRAPVSWCDIHHLDPWEHGGPTDLDNLILLCPYHHHLVHRPDWIVKFDGDDARFINPMGVEIRGP